MEVVRDEVVEAIFGILKRLNSEMDLGIEISEKTPLIGEGSSLDSMAFIDLVGALEEWIDDRFGLYINITFEDDSSDLQSSFGQVSLLADHLVNLIRKTGEAAE